MRARWDLLCLDEAHYLTSTEAKRTQAVLGGNGLIHQATRTWFLSGTPMRNHPGELWPLLYCAGRTPLGLEQFQARYCLTARKRIHGGKWADTIVGLKREMAPELRSMLAPILLRRTKKEVLPDMPPVTVNTVVVEPGPVDEELHFHDEWCVGMNVTRIVRAQEQMFGEKFNDTVHEEARAKLVESMKDKLAMLRRYQGLQKVRGVVEYVKTLLDSGLDKVVIFAWHMVVINEIYLAFKKDYGAATLYGQTPVDKRGDIVHAFQTKSWKRVLVCNHVVAGTGLTLTAAAHVVIAEAQWVPADNAQSIMRCHRIGQDRPVTADFIMLQGSDLDQSISNTLRRKTEDFVRLFGG